MNKGRQLQDPFLNVLRRERVPVAIYLVNGIKLQGRIAAFDQFSVLLENSVRQLVYKHAISTVSPSRNVSLPPAAGAGDDGEMEEWEDLDAVEDAEDAEDAGDAEDAEDAGE